MKNKKLYNMIFPLWAIPIFPFFWFIVIPLNFIIDSIVLILGLKFIKIEDWKNIYKKSIFFVVAFGFLSDIISGLLLYIVGTKLEDINYDIFSHIAYDPINNIYSFSVVLIAVIIAFILIYFFNKNISFKNSKSLNLEEKKKLSLILAIFTTPYIYLFSLDFVNSVLPIFY